MLFTDWTGLCGLALVWMLLVLRVYMSRREHSKPLLVVAAAFCVVMLPVAGLSLAGWLRGMVGDLSITSVLLLATALYTRLRQAAVFTPVVLWNARERHSLLMFLSVCALLLYPFALGIGPLDPYRSGFGSMAFIVLLAALAFWAVLRNRILLPLAIALALLAWSVDWYESSNIWDYLIDAPLAMYALAAMLKLLWINVRRGKRA